MTPEPRAPERRIRIHDLADKGWSIDRIAQLCAMGGAPLTAQERRALRQRKREVDRA